MQGADEGRSREKVSGASVNAADTSLEVRDEVAASSRAELKEVVMSSAPQRNIIVLYAKTGCRPSLGGFSLCAQCAYKHEIDTKSSAQSAGESECAVMYILHL
mgnify:CR=1 FL=1